MSDSSKTKPFNRFFRKKGLANTLFVLTISVILFGGLPIYGLKTQKAEADLVQEAQIYDASIVEILENNNIITFQNNTLAATLNPYRPETQGVRIIEVIITGYSSTPEETDDTPHITATGSWVRDGIVANNSLPFGTKIRIPEIYGNKVFTVEDRMNKRFGTYHIDVWFPSSCEALEFGAKRTYIEVL